jgi:uncharacterized membrane protein HdeD (DUF308 family)
MSSFYGRNQLTNYFKDTEEARKNWLWFLALGVLLVFLGIGVAGSAYYATIFSVFILGFFLFSAGVVQFIQGFMARRWSGLFLSLLLGALYLITGFLCITKPAQAAVSITLWIAALCLIAGLFRMIASLILRFDNWGWVFFNGAVTFILGMLIYSDWPVSGLWVIGTFIGVDLILSGWSWIVMALTARNA